MKVRVHVRGWESDGKVSIFDFSEGIEAIHDGGTLLLVRYPEESAAYEVVGRFAAGAWLYYENVRDTDRAVEHLTARSPEDIL